MTIPPAKPPRQTGKQTLSQKAGLTFPCARVRCHMKEVCFGQRVGAEASVFLSAVLEYLVTEVLEIAGEEAKRRKRQRIAPSHLLECIKNDPDLCAMANNVTFAHTGSCVRNRDDGISANILPQNAGIRQDEDDDDDDV